MTKPALKTRAWAIPAAALIIFVQSAAAETSAASASVFQAPVAVAVPFLASAGVALAGKRLGGRIHLAGVLASAASFLAVAYGWGSAGSLSYTWAPSLGLSATFLVDGLSNLLALVASGVGVLVFLYAGEYMDQGDDLPRFYAVLLAFLGSMLGLVYSGDLVMLFVFWEMTSLSSFFLIGYHRESYSSMYAARKAMAITVGGGFFLLAAFVMIQGATGTFSLVEMLSDPAGFQQSLRSSGLFLPALGALTVGAAAKSAQVPLHIWLPDAMEAPTPVSAFLHSATMVKAGVFLLGRFRPLMAGETWTLVLATLGLGTMAVCSFLAVLAEDIKGLLAYSTSSHLGLIAAGFGLASGAGAAAAAFHMLNHALFKASLFMVAGIVAHEAGTRSMGELSGLGNSMPVAAAVATLGGLSMAGVPPLAGFQSKEILFKGSLKLAESTGGLTWVFPLVAVAGSGLTFIYSLRLVSIFYGRSSTETGRPGRGFVLAPVVLAVAVAVTSALPQRTVDLLVQPAISVASPGYHLHVHLVPAVSPALAMSGTALAAGAAGFRFRDGIAERGRRLFEEHPWLSADRVFDTAVWGAPSRISYPADAIHTGRIQGYVATVAVTAALMGIAGWMTGARGLPQLGTVQDPTITVVLALAGVSAVQLTRTKSQVSGVLTLSVIGAMIAVYYMLASAPDLALTQVTVETLSLIIFMLVLDRLPSYYGETSISRRLRDGAVSIFVGASAFGAVLLATSVRPDRIAGFFVEKAVPEGGGSNVVNVILVDFRGLDTMGEISVVAMAALAIIVFLSSRNREMKGGDLE